MAEKKEEKRKQTKEQVDFFARKIRNVTICQGGSCTLEWACASACGGGTVRY